MKPAACTAVVLAFLLAGGSIAKGQMRGYRGGHSLDLLRLLAVKPWAAHHRWDRIPRIDQLNTDSEQRIPRPLDDDGDDNDGDDDDMNMENDIRRTSGKRSAVATALNSGRRRRQPTPPAALGKAVTPYAGVGLLSNVGSFFESLHDNLETLASLSPQQRSSFFQDTPSVVHAPSAGGGGGGGGGSGIRKLHALRPLRPTGNIRSYNRRSFVEADEVYPGANHHDPGLLWTGLGR